MGGREWEGGGLEILQLLFGSDAILWVFRNGKFSNAMKKLDRTSGNGMASMASVYMYATRYD